jgi:hypothetical protein
MIWRNDDNDRPPIPPRAALLLLIWLAGLLWLLVACSPHMAASAPQLSNVQPEQLRGVGDCGRGTAGIGGGRGCPDGRR